MAGLPQEFACLRKHALLTLWSLRVFTLLFPAYATVTARRSSKLSHADSKHELDQIKRNRAALDGFDAETLDAEGILSKPFPSITSQKHK